MKVVYPRLDESAVREVFRRRIFNRKKKIVKVEENYLPCHIFQLNFHSKSGARSLNVLCDGYKGKVRRIDWPQTLTSSRVDPPKKSYG
jgi:hypothetical protein